VETKYEEWHRIRGKLVDQKTEEDTGKTMKNAVFWDVTPCGCCNNRVSEGYIASTFRITRIGELGKTSAVTSNCSILGRNIILHSIVLAR
jgi:hypothetical protein